MNNHRDDDTPQDVYQYDNKGGKTRGESAQRGFGFQKSPSNAAAAAGGGIGGGLRRPTKFMRSDSQDNIQNGAPQTPTSACQATNSNNRPPLVANNDMMGMGMLNVASASNSVLQDYEEQKIATPRQMQSSKFQMADDTSLLLTPCASEKKNNVQSLLSDDDYSPSKVHNFEPSTRYSHVSHSGKKKGGRTSMAHLSTTAQKDNVKVVIRVRPINEREKAGGPESKVKLCMAIERNEKVILTRQMEEKTFTFDFVATQESEQSELFERISKPIADSCLQGYNGTIFAYGQTGSGKTFTIQGPTIMQHGEEYLIGASNTNNKMHDKRGLMQRSFEYIFECIEQQKEQALEQGIEMQFLIKTSYLEIYNEQIMDLLDPQSYNLHVREDIKKGVYVESLQEETVTNVRDMMDLTTRGARNRHVGSTLMNKESSRSHSVLTTTIESKTMNEEGTWQMKSSRFHIIDLAGSERSKSTNAVGERLKEAGMINKSLTALGIVINSLVEISEGKNRHVHYRDSKLTFLLRDSLGGNSKTVIIANVTAAAISVGETLSTLKFAQRAKLIKNKAIINEESSSTIHLLKQELRRTKKDLAEQTNQLKIAHDQIMSFQTIQEETYNEASTMCKVCKRDVTTNEDDITLHFNDTSMISQTQLMAPGTSVADDSSFIEQTPGGTTPGGGQKDFVNNPKAFKMYKQRAIELQSMKERVNKVEKLLQENLENMDIQQKQHEYKTNTLTKSNKDKQKALEASEKNRARDKMIIKFREERISELESRLNKAQQESQPQSIEPCSSTAKCEIATQLQNELSDARQELAQWQESATQNPQAAKLFAEKEDLLAQKKQLQSELKVSPESLTARIGSLNELTSDLNAYLKEYVMSEGFDKLKQEYEATSQQMTAKVENLEAQLTDKETQSAEKLRSLTEEHSTKMSALNEKLEQMKETFEAEKVKIEQLAQDQMNQLKSNLDTTLAEKGEQLQKEIFDKVEAHEKQQLLQKSIDQLNKALEELQLEKKQLMAELIQETTDKEQFVELQRQTEVTMTETTEMLQEQSESERQQFNQTLKEVSQKANQEIQDLEKEVAAVKEENRMREETCADLERQIRSIKEENDGYQKQVLETNEEIQEKRRHVKEIEAKLNSTIKESQSKDDNLLELESTLKAEIAVQMTKLTGTKSKKKEKSKQLTELTEKLAQFEAESQQKVHVFESTIQKLSTEKTEAEQVISKQNQRVTELQEKEQSLEGLVSMTKGRVEECARMENERKKLFQQDISQMNEKLNLVLQETNQKTTEYKEAKVQLKTMEDLTVSLTEQNKSKDQEISMLTQLSETREQEIVGLNQTTQDQESKIAQVFQDNQVKDAEIAQLKTQIAEKELQIENQIREVGDNNVQLRQSLAEEQRSVEELKQKLAANENQLEQSQACQQQLQNALDSEKETTGKEVEKAQLAKVAVEEAIQQQLRIVEQVKEEYAQEHEQNKVKVEQQFQSLLQTQVEEVKSSLAVNQSKDQELVQRKENEISNLKSELLNLNQELHRQKQSKMMALTSCKEQIEQVKLQHRELVLLVQKEMVWKQIQPEQKMISGLVDQINLISVELTKLQQYRQECQELTEQLAEYKGLTQQLQDEKLVLNARLQEIFRDDELSKIQNTEIMDSLNTQLMTTQTELAETHQMLNHQKSMADDSIRQLNQQYVEVQSELVKYKQKMSEQSNMLHNSKETISSMVSQENQQMGDLKRRINELGEHQVQQKAKITHYKQEKDTILSKYETVKKEVENLRELVKIKDGQIEESRGYETAGREERERIYGENRKLKDMLKKRETETKEIVLTLKAFADEKKRLESEIERMRNQELQIGHNNQAQKIQHHLRIKEENNKLREENFKLQEQVRKAVQSGALGPQTAGAMNSNATFGNLANDAIQQQTQEQSNSELEKSRKELTGLHESVSRLAANLLQLPGVGQFVSSNDQLATHFKKHGLPTGGSNNSTSSATYYAAQKLKGTNEVILHICKQLQQRVQECNQMTQEFKNMEQEIHTLQMERGVLMQKNPQVAQQLIQRVNTTPNPPASSSQAQSQGKNAPNSNTMQPSFQVQQQQQQPPIQRSITMQQQSQSLAQGHGHIQQPNQYRRQSSRGHAASQGSARQSATSKNAAQSQGQSQSNLQAKQMNLILQQQNINRM